MKACTCFHTPEQHGATGCNYCECACTAEQYMRVAAWAKWREAAGLVNDDARNEALAAWAHTWGPRLIGYRLEGTRWVERVREWLDDQPDDHGATAYVSPDSLADLLRTVRAERDRLREEVTSWRLSAAAHGGMTAEGWTVLQAALRALREHLRHNSRVPWQVHEWVAAGCPGLGSDGEVDRGE